MNTVDCRFGKVVVTPTGEDHIYLTSNPDGGRSTEFNFIIRGVPYTVSAHLFRHPDGVWRIGPVDVNEWQRLSGHLFLRFTGNRAFSRDTPSTPAQKSAAAEIESVVNAWAAAHPGNIADAKLQAMKTEKARLDAKRVDLLKSLAVLDEQIEDLTRRILA